ncbi:MAG: CPBP family intramembrane metalloprotease [Gammaproteobacteria bacterium]|nr:CPBP family intramembrane metalloprotease [Gammaproteobacteria bacterium]
MTASSGTYGRPASPEDGPPADDMPEATRPRARSTRPFPTFLQGLGLVVLVLVLQSSIGLAAFLLDPTSGTYSQHPLTLGVANLLAFGIVILVATRRRGIGFAAVCPSGPVSPGILLLVAVLILGTVILLSEVDNLTRLVFPPPAGLAEAFEELLDTRARPISSFFLLVVVAPVTEEVLCRGLILRGFLGNYSKRSAILLSALLFAVMHTNPWQFISAFVAGVLLAWLLIETGSLLPCLFAHAVANGTAYLAGLTRVEVPGFTSSMGDAVQFQPFWLNAVGVAFAVGGYLLLRRTFRDKARPPEDLYRRPRAPA